MANDDAPVELSTKNDPLITAATEGTPLESLRLVLAERLHSPFWGSFILAWSATNWKVLYITAFGDGSGERIQAIERVLSTPCGWWWRALVLPILIASGVIAVLPFLVNHALRVSLYWEDRRRKIKLAYEARQPLTIEESRSLRAESATLQRSNDELDVTVPPGMSI